MSSSLTSKSDTAFVPKPNQSFSLGKETIYVYPDLAPSMSSAEKSYGYMITKSALEAVDSPIRTKLQVLAGCTSTTPLVGILQTRFIQHASLYIKRAGIFHVLSYHGRNGRIINTATLENGNLRPVNDQTNATRRPNGLIYAKIEADVQFMDIDPRNRAIYPYSFFVRLNNEAVEVVNSTGNPVVLNTFHGPDDWATNYDQADLDTHIWNHPRSLVYPFILKPPKIDDVHADAIVESNSMALEKLALEAAWATITTKIFQQICPNITQDPASVIQNIHQSTQVNGVAVELSIEEFFNAIQRMTGFFPQGDDLPWPIDVTQHFITHCNEDVRLEMQADKFAYNSALASRRPYDQLESLQTAYSAAITAELKNSRLRTIARLEVSNQTFLAKAHTSTIVAASVAENTLKKYSGTASTAPNPCWGCNELGHAYASRDGSITCPNKDKPGVQSRAALARKEYNDRLKKRRKDSNKKRPPSVMVTDIFKNLNADQMGKLTGDQIKALISIGSPEKKSREGSKTVSFWIDVICLVASDKTKPILPITIDVNLPHVALAIGPSLTGAQFTLSAAYDTCASLCVGYLDFHLAIAEKLPHLVKSLVWAKDEYSPLTLSGIVSDDADSKKTIKPTSSLPAIIEYHMPYKSREGYQTSLKIALGKGVSVNTIIGLSMIRPAKLSLDLTDDVMEPGVLDTVPFPIIYKPTIQSMPDFTNLDEAELKSLHSLSNSVTIKEIQACRVYIDQSQPAMTVELSTDNQDIPEYPSMFTI